MRELLNGSIERRAYVALLLSLRAIYLELERSLQQRTPDLLALGVDLPDLRRVAALEADLAAWTSAGGVEGASPAPAALAYAERIGGLGVSGVHRLLAHAYVRYLGDLHGGQVLSRLLRERFALGPEGTRFYEFGDAERVLAWRHTIREALGAARLDQRRCDEVVAEALWAFDAHCTIFEQLGGGAAP